MDFIPLVDGLLQVAGNQGFFAMLVEIDESSNYYEQLRKCGFSVYAWQRIWRFDNLAQEDVHYQTGWEASSPTDELSIKNLYQCLVPVIVQRSEFSYDRYHSGLIYKQNDDVLAYIKESYGPEGIYLSPLLHPDLEDSSDLLSSLIASIPASPSRPIYIAVRSYQSGIEYSLDQLGCKPGPRQALMVKHLAALNEVKNIGLAKKVLDNVRPEPTSPIVHHLQVNKKKT